MLRHDVVVSCFFPDRNRSAADLVLVLNEFVEDEMPNKWGEGCFHLDGVHHILFHVWRSTWLKCLLRDWMVTLPVCYGSSDIRYLTSCVWGWLWGLNTNKTCANDRTSPHDLQDRITADIHKIMNAICRSTLTAHVRRTEKCVDNAEEKKNTDFSYNFS